MPALQFGGTSVLNYSEDPEQISEINHFDLNSKIKRYVLKRFLLEVEIK